MKPKPGRAIDPVSDASQRSLRDASCGYINIALAVLFSQYQGDQLPHLVPSGMWWGRHVRGFHSRIRIRGVSGRCRGGRGHILRLVVVQVERGEVWEGGDGSGQAAGAGGGVMEGAVYRRCLACMIIVKSWQRSTASCSSTSYHRAT